MGAWIEISSIWRKMYMINVAPLVGAWIEIDKVFVRIYQKTVAPLVGAWIEIRFWVLWYPLLSRRSPRGSVD